MPVRVKWRGIKEARATVARKARAEPVDAAVRETVAIIHAGAVSAAPVDDGELQAGIDLETGAFHGKVSSTAPHTKFVEYGTAAHDIRPSSREALSFGEHPVEGVSHPGAAAHPFMRPAYEAGRAYLTAKLRRLVS